MTDSTVDTRVTEASAVLASDPDWWRQAAVYQIYPRSFADANGDGIGDLAGHHEPHPVPRRARRRRGLALAVLPVGPRRRRVRRRRLPRRRPEARHPRRLRRDDRGAARRRHPADRRHRAEPLVEPARVVPRGARVAARVGRPATGTSSATARGPTAPSRRATGSRCSAGPRGSAVGDGQFYLHLFAPEQPDFNWANPEVRADFLTTLRFWADRGVDGFRVDVAHALAKDLTYPLRSHAELEAMQIGAEGSHPLWDREELDEIYAEWRAVFDEYDPPRIAVAEAWVEPARRHRYARADEPRPGVQLRPAAGRLRRRRVPRDHRPQPRSRSTITGSSNTWVFSNHDVVRHATRYGLPDDHGNDGAGRAGDWLLIGRHRPRRSTPSSACAAPAPRSLLMLALPGSAYLYQGEELGLPEVADLPDAERQDPTFFRSPGVDVGPRRMPRAAAVDARRAARSASAPTARTCRSRRGSASTRWRPRRRDPDSTLSLYRRALCAAPRPAGRRAARRGTTTRRAPTTCSGSSGRAAGTRSRTSATRPSSCPTARCS